MYAFIYFWELGIGNWALGYSHSLPHLPHPPHAPFPMPPIDRFERGRR